ncbi:PAS domain S-box protein [Pedobacter faecalis]|uniref:PAS domain S-box protein n=1 Tax=Pedobacter faecalis TaxID=3041495 RepID=UPI00254BA1E0|nr:PAS domain S-box protein [Pedobacter sp. ELA7]
MRDKSTANFDLEYFFDLSPDLLCVAGYDGFFKKINPAVCNTLGFSSEELLSAPIQTFVHPEDRELTLRKQEEVRKGSTLFQFENRFMTKEGAIVWLMWTSVRIARDEVIFAVAKDITTRKRAEQDKHASDIIGHLNSEQMKRFTAEMDILRPTDDSNLKWLGTPSPLSQKDQAWLNQLEAVVRNHTKTLKVNLNKISADMAMSERQLFREVSRIMGTTPNRLVCIIRLHLAWEAIASRKYRTIDEVARIAGYSSTPHFKKLFNNVYGIDISELI